MKHTYYLLFLIFGLSLFSIGQSDTITKLSFSNFMQLVKQNHPIAKQADLLIKSADANTLMARGSFDPKLFYDFNNKFFDSKNYYELGNGGISIPTWFGIELKGGYEQNRGMFLNPEKTMPDQGLVYAQISIPLLKGLLIDERRSTLKQAKLFQEQSEFDKINLINDLLYAAGKTYWDWNLSYSNLQVHQNSVKISQERFEAIKKASILGDRPAIDTLEANIQLQDRIINFQQALMENITFSLKLSNFLWVENDMPILLTDKVIPDIYIGNNEDLFLNTNFSIIDSLIDIHPQLKMYNLKLQQLDIERRFKQDKLKPNLRVNYNPLFNAENLSVGYQNNYIWGVSAGFPILLRNERGDLKVTKIKIENTQLEVTYKRNELINKTKASINEFNIYKNQIDIYSKNVSNYEQLWNAERRLLNNGESSLFMINSREMSYINAQLKLNEIINKNKKAALDVEYSFGLLNGTY